MREILFRAKRKNDGKWMEGFPVRIYDYGGKVWEMHPFETNFNVICGVIPETICQFTGLTDKNGKRIFEGDRCRVSRPCVLAYGKITFQNGCFWFVDDGPGGMLRLCDVKMNGFEIKVIGNIHDNPELLENP